MKTHMPRVPLQPKMKTEGDHHRLCVLLSGGKSQLRRKLRASIQRQGWLHDVTASLGATKHVGFSLFSEITKQMLRAL